MKALIWIAAILAVLVLLLLLVRLRITGVYGEEGPSLTVALGALPLLKLPRPKKEKPAKGKKRPKKEKKKKEEETVKNKGGSEPGFRKELEIIGRLLGKLRQRLSIDELTLWYLSAGDDPAATALLFGGANAAAYALYRAVESIFRVKKRDIRTSVSFTESKPKVYAKLRLSVSLGILLWILGKAALERKRAQRKAGKN